MLPTFIHIGPSRTATTMCYQALWEHPEACVSTIKETDYFSTHYDRGMDWYQRFFEHCSSPLAVGEISNSYFPDPDVPRRIAAVVPEVKIVTVLRNPFERMRSVYRYLQKNGTIGPDTSLAQALRTQPTVTSGSSYGDSVNRYLKYFPRQKVRILFYDDLVNDPETFIRSLFAFIEVDEGFTPRAIHERINPSVSARHPGIASLAYRIADLLHSWQLHRPLRWVRETAMVKRLLFVPAKAEESDDQSECCREADEIVAPCFIPQIKEIERITGRDLSSWYSHAV